MTTVLSYVSRSFVSNSSVLKTIFAKTSAVLASDKGEYARNSYTYLYVLMQ